MNIDWNQVLTAAIQGAVLGGAFALTRVLYKKLEPRFGRTGAILLAMGAVAAGLVAIAVSPLGRRAMEHFEQQRARARIARLMTEHMMPVLKSPAFAKRIEGLSQSEVDALALRLSAEGLLRLPDERLVTRLHLLGEAIAVADVDTCAAQFVTPTPEQALRLIAGLSDTSLVAWSKLSAEASAASLEDAPRRAPEPEDARLAFQSILASLAETDANRLATALTKHTEIDAVEACWATKTIYGSVVNLPSAEQTLVARVLAMQ